MSISRSSKPRVDVVREQERRARLQLLDEIREPSPQPIFGEPVKVELEDETSRRIKNTLGDFTQVLINDSKNLLGIQRSSSSTSAQHGGTQSGRGQPVTKRPPVANGMYKPSPSNIPKHPAPDKRLGYPRNKPHDPINCPPSSLHNADSRLKDQTQWDNSHQRKLNPAPPLNGNSQSAAINPSYSSAANPSLGPNLSNLPSNKAYPFHGRNGMVSNATVQAPRYGESLSSAPPPKRSIFRPSILKLPERKPEKHAESPIELETILREMKQAVPPPLTAIQTPRTEESGFAFPDDPKEEVILSRVKELKLIKSPVFVPQPPEPPKLKESNSRQSTPSPCISSSLQDDLEMSDSDDEAVTIVKSIPAEFPKSPVVNTASHISNNSSTTVNNSNMNVPQAVPSSSSSESGDSDSDDSSSESNDSDSSASSDASDADTPSKMWGLSNFFEETRRNHSPAFIPVDTSTNSTGSAIAVKEEPAVVPADARTTYTIVDDDSVHDILQDPIADNIPDFLDAPVNIKDEVLSPITSPLRSSGPPAPLLPPPPPPPPPPAIRGPRTPPSPSYPVKDESVEAKRNSASSGNVQTEPSQTVELTVQHSRHSGVQQNSCDTKEDLGNVQLTTAKKQPRLSKNKTDTFSPRTESSPVTQASEDDEPSASKGLSDVSLDKDENDVASSLSISSCSVPSETSESSHENYSIKTRQKLSKSSSSKKAKSLSEESLSESGQKENSSKSSVPKFKHPTRTCRASNETKQLSKVVKSSAKSDLHEETKTSLVKSDTKDKSSLEKSKIPLKTVGNTKGVSKNSVKVKKKPPKVFPKQSSEGKKSDMKKKKSKFHIENFLQSPTISQSESGLLPKVSSTHSPSRDRSPFPEYKNSNDNKRRPSVSPSCASRSPSRSSSKSVERVKGAEKLRRSTRCSERVSSIGQAESSLVAHQDSDTTRKTAKRAPKLRERSGSPIHVEAPPLLLSPIPHDSPIPVTLSECAIPNKIMVCIPLDKLSRLPGAAHALDLENKPASKSKLSQQHAEESVQKKESVLQKRPSKSASSKISVLKDIKDKPRTESNAKSNKNNKSLFVGKKDKNVKASSESSLTLKSKTASSVNSKTSIKAAEGKLSWDSSASKVSKKRKNEGEDKQLMKKKPKTYPELNQEKMPFTPLRTDSPNLPEVSTKSKGLERCDSVSSFSSLSSQTSSKSSKLSREKRSSSTLSDSKRGKSSCIPVKHIKQEKEEKIKTTIKKEPGTPDKNKEFRDKIIAKEGECNQKALEPLWSDTSSQCCQWSDQCKEETKGPLPISSTLLDCINRVCGLDWDHFGHEITKDLKDASTKDNSSPIMPMDYYYTEGKKQKHLAEKEKDPLLQTLKYFEATVLFILTSQQQEEYTKEPESVYQFYRETLNFSNLIFQNVRIQQASPGSIEFKLLILLLRCQALLHVKLYNLKLKEIKEQQKQVSDFFLMHCPTTVRSLARPNHPNSRLSLTSVPSPHSPTPSPASSVNSQTSGYSSSDISGNPMRGSMSHLSQPVNVSQSMLEKICRQHTHLINLHMGHDLWEQADMYMTRSNLREFFKEVADQSENLTLHSSIKDLVNYVQTGISLVKKCSR